MKMKSPAKFNLTSTNSIVDKSSVSTNVYIVIRLKPVMNKYIFLLSIFQIYFHSLAGQDTVCYFGNDFRDVSTIEEAKYKKSIYYRNSKVTRLKSFVKKENSWKAYKSELIRNSGNNCFTIKGTESSLFPKKTERCYASMDSGLYIFKDYSKGKLIREGTTSRLLPLQLQDTVNIYYAEGSIKSIARYKNNKLIGNQNWLKNGSGYVDNIFYHVDATPEHSNGPLFFKHYILDGIRKAGIDLTQISDMVVLGWVIMENGETEGIHRISGVFRELNNTLIQLVKDLPGEWIPASLNGKPVNYYMEIPFNFRNRDESFETLEISSGFVIWD